MQLNTQTILDLGCDINKNSITWHNTKNRNKPFLSAQ